MTTYLTIFVLGALAWIVLRRLLVRVLFGAAMVVVVAFAGRLALMADDRLSQPNWLTGGLIGGGVGFVVVGILLQTIIYNLFVNARRANAHERVDKEHDGMLR